MNHKIRIIIFLSIVFIFMLTGIRIYYVNKVLYKIPEKEMYAVGDVIINDGLELQVLDFEICNGEKYESSYDPNSGYTADDYDIIMALSIKNISDEVKSFNSVATGMMYGNKYGGNVNPFVFATLNEGVSGTVSLETNEETTVYLVFPYNYETLHDDAKLIISLYPRHISILLR